MTSQPLASNRGRLIIAGSTSADEMDRIKPIECSIQSFTLPGISTTPVFVGTPTNHDLYLPGDTLILEDLSVNILLDEDMEIFDYFWNWMSGNSLGEKKLSDMSIIVNSNKGNPTRALHYYNAFPYNIAGINYDFSNVDTDVVGSLLFKFSHFDIKPLGSI